LRIDLNVSRIAGRLIFYVDGRALKGVTPNVSDDAGDSGVGGLSLYRLRRG
jgi:hypothetical protein